MSKEKEPRINREINVTSIRLIDHTGTMLGVVSVSEALKMAERVGLDLVEVSPNAEPPVCKILDYGKYRYELQKKEQEARKKQKVIQIKEIKLRPTIDKHDLEIKLRHAKAFLEDDAKVRFTLRFRGREMDHKDLGMNVFKVVEEALAEHGKIESPARFEGRQIGMMIGPK